jgi:hypothetical protein
VSAARELRDRYLEQVNTPGAPGAPLPQGKYHVVRQIAHTTEAPSTPAALKQLPQAA